MYLCVSFTNIMYGIIFNQTVIVCDDKKWVLMGKLYLEPFCSNQTNTIIMHPVKPGLMTFNKDQRVNGRHTLTHIIFYINVIEPVIPT